jgi:ferredoxin
MNPEVKSKTAKEDAQKPKKFLVRYNRNDCIGAFSCTAILPEDWEVASDGKADLAKSNEVEPGIFEREISPQEYEAMMESADVCPVNVIQILEKTVQD